MSRTSKRRYSKQPDRRVWVFSELNRDARPERIARILTAAGLEQARLEAEAIQEHSAESAQGGDSTQPKEVPRD